MSAEGRNCPAFYLRSLRRADSDRGAIAELYRMR